MTQVRLHTRPLTLAEANQLVENWHRHHKKCLSHRFSIGVYDSQGGCHGAAIVGRPVGGGTEGISQLHIAEVSRLVTDGTPNACSLLYGACARAAKAMGFIFIQTYILGSEPGTSLRAAGWKFTRLSHPQGWSNGNRPRDEVPDEGRRKQLYRLMLNDWHLDEILRELRLGQPLVSGRHWRFGRHSDGVHNGRQNVSGRQSSG